MIYSFDPHINIKDVVIVGLGGTGSQLARSVARIIYDMRRRNIKPPSITFIDPDVIEAKNVGRQMFTPSDVGEYKAEVLARRFNYALGMGINWVNEPFDAGWMRDESQFSSRLQDVIVMGAVDNHLARAEIAKAQAVWIDCGNHYSSGQVVIGNTNEVEPIFFPGNMLVEEGSLRLLPNVTTLFPSMLQPDLDAQSQPDLSCAELVEAGQQHLLINDMIAGIAAQYLYKLLHRQPITSFMTFVDIESLVMRSVPITEEDLRAYLPVEEEKEVTK